MKLQECIRVVAAIGLCFRFAADSQSLRAAETPAEIPGLAAQFTLAGGKDSGSDTVLLPNVWLYVPAGQPPTPFLSGGRFTVEWKGNLMIDLRAEYAFQVETRGEFKLEINGSAALDGSSDGSQSIVGKPVRLNKGTNTLVATFRSPATGDAFVRLNWSPKGNFFVPIPSVALKTASTPELQKAVQVHLGRELVGEFRCVRCHQSAAAPDLSMDAPSFEGIGSRRNASWITQWIEDPKAQRPVARMPRMLHGDNVKDDAQAIATFLGSLKDGSAFPTSKDAVQIEAGNHLFDVLHCAACHLAPNATESDPQRIALKHVRQKFPPGALAAFLQKPDAHFTWTRMPDFKLTHEEADKLSAFLDSTAAGPDASAVPAAAASLERGKSLVQTTGCLNCHGLKLENQFKAKALAEITPADWQKGCLAKASDATSKAPRFDFSDTERAALLAFAETDRAALTREVPAEFAQRQTKLLRCTECHGKFKGFPAFDILGGKLRPEWMASFIAGDFPVKPRFWLEDRMPAFTQRARQLAEGLAMTHGYPPQTPPEPPMDADAAKIGQRLLSAEGGLFCVQCHGVAKVKAVQVFESNGINLALTGARIQKAYYYRWLRNPLGVEPSAKMPAYFDELGKSPLQEFYEGSGDKQIEAIWQFIRLGDQMPPPPGTTPAP